MIPQNFDMPNLLNKVSSSEIDLEALRSKRQKIMSDCGVIPQKINISSSESNSMKDDQALEEEAQREMQEANEMIERLEREEQEREMREAEEDIEKELIEQEAARLLA